MGNPIHLVCDKCKTKVFIGKNSPYVNQNTSEGIEHFLYIHHDDYGAPHCDSSFRVLDEHQTTIEQFLYKDASDKEHMDSIVNSRE